MSLVVKKIDILNPVKHGQPLCLKCVYRLNRGEEFRGIMWYKNDDILFSYSAGHSSFDSNRPTSEPYKFTYVESSVIDASISYCL